MASVLDVFKHLEIELEKIKSATNNFDEKKVIGRGGFGKVYEANLAFPHSEGEILVALKRLDRKYGQGDPEFYKEIRFLSCYRHENLISLLGFANQGGEMILVYEHATGGSLDRILHSAALTWPQRLKICLDAAKGISFLHDPKGTNQRVLHCDIKSANILLDRNKNAKVSDFGLSKIGPANQQYSALITNAYGTPGYCDPVFMETYSLTKESDVYSFGVVLFEVLCGRLCAEFSKGQFNILVPMWKKSYEEKKLDDIIFKYLKQQMDQKSLETFADIAFQCLQKDCEQRPPMSLVVQKLKIALEIQDPVSFKFSDSPEDSVDALIEWVMRDAGFSRGKPVAAFTIYKCLVHWKSFEFERTSVFDRLILMICLAIEDHQDNNEHMTYWLSSTSALLFLIQRSLKSPPPTSLSRSVRRSPPPKFTIWKNGNVLLVGREMKYNSNQPSLSNDGFRSSSVSLAAPAVALEGFRSSSVSLAAPTVALEGFRSSSVSLAAPAVALEGFRSSSVSLAAPAAALEGLCSSSVSLTTPAAALEVVCQVEAKYPALLFKQQLTACVEKICGIVRDNLKKELRSLLALCIQAPQTSKGVLYSHFHHWQGMVDCLNTLLNTLKEKFAFQVPPIIVQKIFSGVFSYINVQLLNSLLLRRECCTLSNGEFLKAGLAVLEMWCGHAKEEYVGSAWEELKHIRQAVGFLVIHKKYTISYDDITNDLCPVLSVQQLCIICTLYWDDYCNTKSVSQEVISSMRVLMEEDANTSDSLLDDNSSIPFSADDLSTSLEVKDFADMKPAVELAKNPAFLFLL